MSRTYRLRNTKSPARDGWPYIDFGYNFQIDPWRPRYTSKESKFWRKYLKKKFITAEKRAIRLDTPFPIHKGTQGRYTT